VARACPRNCHEKVCGADPGQRRYAVAAALRQRRRRRWMEGRPAYPPSVQPGQRGHISRMPEREASCLREAGVPGHLRQTGRERRRRPRTNVPNSPENGVHQCTNDTPARHATTNKKPRTASPSNRLAAWQESSGTVELSRGNVRSRPVAAGELVAGQVWK